jgi:ABC-type branched-subunit amino acid transport system ATPase component
VLRGIDLSIEEKEIVAVIGPNGAGKSTTLKAIFGLVEVTDGGILFRGENITNLKTGQILRRGISYIPQGRSVFPSLSVMENIEMGGYMLNSKRLVAEKIQRVFSLFPRLEERRSQIAGSLSGGEQQILSIGRAMMLDPILLLLDEPSLGLEPNTVDLVFDKIRQINALGTTIVIVEQKVSEVLEIVQRGYVFDMGKVVIEGAAVNLLNSNELKAKYLGT